MTSYSTRQTIDTLAGHPWQFLDTHLQPAKIAQVARCAAVIHFSVETVQCITQSIPLHAISAGRFSLHSLQGAIAITLFGMLCTMMAAWAKDIPDIRMVSDRAQLHKADKCLCSHAHKRRRFMGPEATHRTIPALAQKLQIWSSKWSSRVSRGDGAMHWCCGGVGIQEWECDRAAGCMCMHGPRPFLGWLAVDSYDVQLC